MTLKAIRKLQKARKKNISNKRIHTVAYRVSGFSEDDGYMEFSGIIKKSENMIGTLFRRHKGLEALSKINLRTYAI
jgi:hypothetical protein